MSSSTRTRSVGTAGARSLLGLSVTTLALGIALSTAESQALGSWLAVGSLVLLVFAIHRLGRSGPDGPSFEGPRKRKRRRDRSASAPASD